MNEKVVWIKGAGELGSAVAVSLRRVGLRVLLSEIETPLAIRRTVAFSDAVFGESVKEVEGIPSKLTILNDHKRVMDNGAIPIVVDQKGIIDAVIPDIIVDARMLKIKVKSMIHDARLTVGLGPGFTSGENCHAVIENSRGHSLGKIIWDGSAISDTGIPGKLGGETVRRVIRAVSSGRIEWDIDFGEKVVAGQSLGLINGQNKVISSVSGIVRGLISQKIPVTKNLKIADIDPRGSAVNFHEISDKARCIARGVMESIFTVYPNYQKIE
ncbi:MAG: selenium-dependent molybdenum cofactor biosynthesis protein YqeB [Candidatus Neomarinimicrobiota bacterium]